MKVCSKCNERKELKEFNSSKQSKDGKSSWCKICVRNKSDEHYVNNKKSIYEKVKIYNKINTLKAQELIDSLKEGKQCEKCEYNKMKCSLDFHHRDPKQKEFNISTGGKKKLERILKEIEKCIILCSNCHREFHYLERQNNITIEEYLK